MELVLLGGGGHCKSVIDIIEQRGQYVIKGIIENAPLVKTVLSYSVIGNDSELDQILQTRCNNIVITIGQIRTSEPRYKVYQLLKNKGANFPIISSPRSYVSTHASVDEGSVVFHNAIINAGAKIGKACIINTGTIIEHDSIVDDFCHISTATVINADCHIEEHCFISSNAVINRGVTIGHHSIVASGAVVTKDLPPFSYVMGIPAVQKNKTI